MNPDVTAEKAVAAAEALAEGKLPARGNGDQPMDIGKPGSVNWLAPLESPDEVNVRERNSHPPITA